MLEILLSALKKEYPVPFEYVELLRDMMGYVCLAKTGEEKYVFKLFREYHTEQALQSVEIMTYLNKTGYPVPQIIPALNGKLYCVIDVQNKRRIGVLYEYIPGKEPDKETDMEALGWQTGKLHKMMKAYTGKLVCHSKDFFINRYINLLSKMAYPEPVRFEEYGSRLWERVKDLPKGFCHGDYHTGNMLRDTSGKYVIFDFDAAANANPVFDIAVLCDMTDYFSLQEAMFYKTKRLLEHFLKGYGKHLSISPQEKIAVFDFIAIRHFEVQATILENLGLTCVDHSFIDSQYSWLMQWEMLIQENFK